MSPKERRFKKIKNRCFNCLRKDHKSPDCLQRKTCRLCKQRHHQSICQNNQQSPSPPTQVHQNTAIGESVHTTTTKGAVLLQTARAVATNPKNGLSTPVRILFDS